MNDMVSIILIIIIIIIFILSTINFFWYNKQVEILQEELSNATKKIQNKSVDKNDNKVISNNYEVISDDYNSIPNNAAPLVPIPTFPPPPVTDPVRVYDDVNFNDPFAFPTARPPNYIFRPMINNPIFNIPTKGFPDSPAYVANLIETRLLNNTDGEDGHFDERSILQLIGQQKYPNSCKYDYYVLLTKNRNPPMKIKIHTKNNEELYTGDQVVIPELGNKVYTVRKNDSPYEYSPWFI